MQAVWQKHIDASISSTVNVPESFSVDDTEELYKLAWKSGLKGVTIFRENCARIPILSSETSETPAKAVEMDELPRGYITDVSDDLI